MDDEMRNITDAIAAKRNLFDGPEPQEAPPSMPRRAVGVQQRGARRAIAVNLVALAREHAGHSKEAWSIEEADTLVAIMDLIDRIAG